MTAFGLLADNLFAAGYGLCCFSQRCNIGPVQGAFGGDLHESGPVKVSAVGPRDWLRVRTWRPYCGCSSDIYSCLSQLISGWIGATMKNMSLDLRLREGSLAKRDHLTLPIF